MLRPGTPIESVEDEEKRRSPKAASLILERLSPELNSWSYAFLIYNAYQGISWRLVVLSVC